MTQTTTVMVCGTVTQFLFARRRFSVFGIPIMRDLLVVIMACLCLMPLAVLLVMPAAHFDPTRR